MKKKLLGVLLGISALFAGFAFAGCEDTAESSSSACEHTYSVVEMEAKCLTDGQRISTCTKCGYVETLTLEKLGHDLGEAVVTEATCTSPKTLIAQCKRAGCGGFEQTTEGEALGHDYKEVQTLAATCTDDEKVVYECDRCELLKTEVKEGGKKATGHNHQVVENGTTTATCTTAGGTLYRCDNANCGDEYTEVVPATGHTSDKVKADVTEPSCTEKGYTTYHCSVCNKDYKSDYTQATGHSLVAGPTATASCSSMGYDSKVCNNSDDCDYIERSNIKASTEHKFGADGKCESCKKTALEAFALVCGEKDAFLIEAYDNNVYRVYSKSYAEKKVRIPYSLLQALVAKGVSTINVSLGSNDKGEARSLSIKVDGGAIKYINTGGNELKAVASIVIADAEGKILPTISQTDGITLAIYYRAMNYAEEATGGNKVNSYAIQLNYTRTFDINDSTTWIDGALPYTYDATKNVYDITGITMNAHYKFTIRPELIKYYKDNNYIGMKVSFEGKEGQRVYLWVNGTAKNISFALDEVALTDELATKGFAIDLLVSDLYGTAWNPQYPADGCIMKIEFVEAFTEKYYVYSITTGATVSYDATTGWTVTNPAEGTGCYVCIDSRIVKPAIAEGKTKMVITFDNAYDSDKLGSSWFESQAVKNGGWTAISSGHSGSGLPKDTDGNRYLEIDLSQGYDFDSWYIRMTITQASLRIKSITFAAPAEA